MMRPSDVRRSHLAAAWILQAFLTVACMPVPAQEKSRGPERFDAEITKLQQKFVADQSPTGGVLFVGSSSIRLWKVQEAFPGLSVRNHGFGGSTLADSVHFFERIVQPVRPEAVVLYAGDNDLAGGKSPEQVTEDFRSLAELMLTRLPECRRVLYLSIKPSIKRWANAEKIRQTNTMIRDECQKHERLTFVDIWPLMLDSAGQPRADLLVDDGLHLNADGYVIWNQALAPLLKDFGRP